MQITQTVVKKYDLQKEEEALALAKYLAAQELVVHAGYTFGQDEMGLGTITGSKLKVGDDIHEHIGEGALAHEFVFEFVSMVKNLREHGMDYYTVPEVQVAKKAAAKASSEGLTKGPVSKTTQVEIVEMAKAGMTIEQVAAHFNRRVDSLKKYWPAEEPVTEGAESEDSEEVIVKK